MLNSLAKVKGGMVFTYGRDGDYTPKFHLCLQLGFSLNCNAKIRKKIGICKYFMLKNLNANVKDCKNSGCCGNVKII